MVGWNRVLNQMSQVGRESRVESDRMGGMDNTLDDKGAS